MFKFLINKNYKKIEKYQKIVNKINIKQKKIQFLSDEELQQQTNKLKNRIKDGENLEDILPEAFATAKEAVKRILQLDMFDVQILGGIILHKGKIAEMKTGEGKTIVSILPAYLNCLNSNSVHIITVNDYLAKRDAEWVGQVHKFLKLKVGLVQQNMNKVERQINYNCDVVYITNSELGFDYLKDNMAIEKKEVVQNKFHYAIIDEVDSILIDEARTPLIISGPSEAKTTKYVEATSIAKKLKDKLDYEIDEKSRNITLTDIGISNCEKILKIKDLYNINNPWAQYIVNALKAKELFFKDQNYIIRKQEIIIVDEFTGRIMHGRRWSDGLHQAIESKEKLPIQNENKTLASITYQNLFLLYNKLSGMTGTAKTEENELDKIYNLQVFVIPTNRICIRKELFDLVYKNEYSKWQAIARECIDMNKIGRPVLVGTTNIEKSELLAKILDSYKLKYNLLNAKPENVDREAEIIAQAGRENALTISTNMAGRGTDIILGGNPKALSKLIFINFIKDKIYYINKSNIYRNNEFKEIYEKLEKYKKEIIVNKIFDNISIENVDEYLYNIINTNNLINNNDLILTKVYIKILKYYEKISKREKEKVIKLGGLHVIGTERHESRRIDNQLRGRSGRQGDPGSSRFFLSLDDNLLRIFGGDKIKNLMQNLKIDDDTPIESTILNKSLDTAQRKVESYFYDIRKQLFEYDAVINKQRQAIYSERKKILESNFLRDCIVEYAESTINEILLFYKVDDKSKKQKLENISNIFNLPYEIDQEFCRRLTIDELHNFLYEQVHITYDLKEAYLEQLRPGLVRQLEKYYLLEQIDQAWQEHLEKMTILRESISWRSYGQQDPLIEYKNEAFNLFISMTSYIRQTVVYLIMRSRLIIDTQQN
uniref:Protein translocase subunit SecA n=1 Tax=Synarthrophyton chejuense TaxID=2485825 RepID=A0A3G3MFM0_9FLOR|nr:preprotein translocase subunit SecA [Synarthrophyton chejuense]AYR05625.1 preprotein translocase subunit SecA [Synarthrophyton chejuense]